MNTLSKKQLDAWVYIFIFIAVVLQSYAVSCGLSFTYDSHDYVYASNTFKISFEFYNANGSIYVERAPLFPLLLSISSSKYIWAIINVLNLALCLYFAYKLGQKLFKNAVILILFMLSQAFSVTQLMIHSFLWSEPLFLLLLLIFLNEFYNYLQEQKKSTFIKLILLAFIFAIHRTPGIFFIAGAGLSLCILLPKQKLFSFKKASVFTILASIGWGLWLFRNLSFKGTEYHPATEVIFQNFFINIYHYSNVVTAWFLPLNLNFWIRIVFLFLSILTFTIFFKKNIFKLFQQKFIISLTLIFGTYTFALLSLENVGYHESERYYSLVYFPILLIFFLFWDSIFKQITVLKQKIIVIALSLWLLYPIYRSIKNAQLWHYKSCAEETSKTN